MLRPSVNIQIDENDSLNCMIADGFWYYDIWKANGNPPKIYEYLLSSARNTVCIWDPYTNSEDCVLFKSIKKEVDVKCLTFWGNDGSGNPPRRQRFLDEVKKIQKNNKFGLMIKFYNTFKDSTIGSPFHDRYLFVDDNVYMVGASMGYHHNNGGKISSTSIHLIKEISTALLIKDRFNQCWRNENSGEAINLVGGDI